MLLDFSGPKRAGKMGLALEKEPMPFWLCGCLIFFVGLLKLSRLSLKLFERGEWWGIPPSNTQQNHTKSVLDHNKKSANSSTTVKGHTLLEKGPSSIIAKIGARRLAFERSDSSIANVSSKVVTHVLPEKLFLEKMLQN